MQYPIFLINKIISRITKIKIIIKFNIITAFNRLKITNNYNKDFIIFIC